MASSASQSKKQQTKTAAANTITIPETPQINSFEELSTAIGQLQQKNSTSVEDVYDLIFSFYGFLFQTLLTNDNDLLATPVNDPLIVTLTPASDLVFAGLSDFQLVFARTGNDTIYPFNHNLNLAKDIPIHIDLLFGDSDAIKLTLLQDTLNIFSGNPPTQIEPFIAPTSDRFILGDWRTSYYADDAGYDAFAFIYDFNPNQDVIQLRGKASDYTLVDVPQLGTAIFEKEGNTRRKRAVEPEKGQKSVFEDDLVGIIFNPPNNYNIDLESSSFRYVGTAPSTLLVEPDIKQIASAPLLTKSKHSDTPKTTLKIKGGKVNDALSGVDFTTDIAVDPWGNVYVLGLTNGVLPGSSGSGSYDAWVQKYNNDGELLMSQQFGSGKAETALGITTDKWGNFYVVGSTPGDFITPLHSEGGDAYVIKFDSNGNRIWARQFGSDLFSGATDIVIDDDGNAYVSGLTIKPDPRPDSDPNKIFPVQDDFWAAKFDTNGNQQWMTTVGSPLNSPALFDEAYAILLNTDNSVYTGGWTFGDFSGQGGFTAYDAQIAKYNKNTGALQPFSPNPGQTVNQLGTPTFDFGKGLAHDSQGNLYNVGWTFGDFGGANAGQEDIWIAKTRLDGAQEWVRQFGTSGEDGLFLGGIAIDDSDNIFISGYTNGSLGGQNKGGFDAWVARYDTLGNQVWIKQLGTAEYDYATNLAVDNLGNIFLTGFTEGTLGAVNAGAADAWVAKLNSESGDLLSFNIPTVKSKEKKGSSKSELLQGTSKNDILIGQGGDDTLFGYEGSDTLDGGQGDDVLYGGSGSDRFSFTGNKSFYQAKLGVDQLADFSTSENDRIVLSKTVFTKLNSSIGEGFNNIGEFAAVNGSADRSTALIAYDLSSGGLYYNHNGAAAGFGKEGGLFAEIAGAPTIDASSFRVVA